MNITISERNQKLAGIPSFSVSAGMTCPLNAPCRKKCYALRMERLHRTVKDSYHRNTMAVALNPEQTAREIIQYLKARRNTVHVFRWNVSGDFNLAGYFRMACRVAEETPWVTHYAYTKCYRYLLTKKPENFKLLASVWGSYRPHVDGKKIVRVYVKDRDGKHFVPKKALHCDCKGTCAGCANPCWKLKPGENLVLDEH